MKNSALKNFEKVMEKRACVGVSFIIKLQAQAQVCNFIKKETLDVFR